jgi:hypothetical protein
MSHSRRVQRTPGWASTVGALIALALDAVIGVGSLLLTPLAAALIWVATVALLGLAVAPIIGWRYGPAAVGKDLDWVPRAIRDTVLVSYGAWVVYILGFLGVLGPPGGPGTEGPFLIFALIEGLFYACLPVVVAAVPFGLAWRWILRAANRHRVAPATP